MTEARASRQIWKFFHGEVAERLMATVLKTVEVNSFREFESRPLRQNKTSEYFTRMFCLFHPLDRIFFFSSNFFH